jgi:hypothetical protein
MINISNISQNSSSSSAQRHQRDASRLTKAAWSVGSTHQWFHALPCSEQITKVTEWVNQAHVHAAERRAANYQRYGHFVAGMV